MDVNKAKTHLKNTIDLYMDAEEQDKSRLLLQDVFIDDNKEVYRLIGIIR
jgi:hypothetical protein